MAKAKMSKSKSDLIDDIMFGIFVCICFAIFCVMLNKVGGAVGGLFNIFVGSGF